MAAQREYTTVFSIGGRLLGSFKGAFAGANRSLMRLQATAQMAMRGFRRAATLAAGALGLIFGSSLIAGGFMLRKIFEDAGKALMEDEDRARRLTFALMANETIQKRGLPFARQITENLNKQATTMATQGFLSEDMVANMQTWLAVAGMSPRVIKESMGPMADQLAAAKQTAATEEDAATFAKAHATAIRTGMTRQLREFGVILSKPQQAYFAQLVKGGQIDEAHKYLINTYKRMKGANAETMKAMGASAKKLGQELGEMSERIGKQLLPLQDQLAYKWRRLIPILEPIISEALSQLTRLATWGSQQFDDFISRMSKPDATQAWKDMKSAFGELGTSLGDLGKQFGLVLPQGQSFGTFIANFAIDQIQKMAKEIRELAEAIEKLMESWRKFRGWAKDITVREKAWEDSVGSRFWNRLGWSGPKGAAGKVGVAPPGMLSPGMKLDAASVKKIQDERAPLIKELRTPGMQRLLSGTLAAEAGTAEGQKDVLESLVNRAAARKRAGTYKSMEDMITGGFYGPVNRGEISLRSSAARLKQVEQMTKSIEEGRNILRGMTDQGMPNEIHGYREMIRGEAHGFMEGLPEQFQTAAFSAVPALQHGGIVRKHGLYRLAERGSELVIPLKRLAKAVSWRQPRGGATLDDLVNASGGSQFGGMARLGRMIGTTAGSRMSLNFSPNITINGNATEAEQHAMDTRLRDLAREFIAQFTAAQYQERRLSYQGGY